MTKNRGIGRGGKRSGAGRKPASIPAPSPTIDLASPVDPIAILEGIASDGAAPATARVNACKALIAANGGLPPHPKGKALSDRALEIMSRPGKGH